MTVRWYYDAFAVCLAFTCCMYKSVYTCDRTHIYIKTSSTWRPVFSFHLILLSRKWTQAHRCVSPAYMVW